VRQVVADRDGRAGHHLQRAEGRLAPGEPRGQLGAHTWSACSGQKKIGIQPSAARATFSTFRGPVAATKMGIWSRTG
jgi:hypothetical protein